uniref:Uncharacterized protein n=1 Tax=Bracon brevicornis TaxID=1563983 RepID=A0A6V7ILR9_9HYME
MFNTMTDTVICGLLKMMTGHLEILVEDYSTIFEDIFICPGEDSPRTVVGKKLLAMAKESKNNEKETGKKRDESPEVNALPPIVMPQISTEDMTIRVAACVEYALAIEKLMFLLIKSLD